MRDSDTPNPESVAVATIEERSNPACYDSSQVLLCFRSLLSPNTKPNPPARPPSDLAPGFTALLDKTGTKIVDDKGATLYEIWLRTEMPTGPKAAEENVTMPEIPHGALLGVIRFAKAGSERRGNSIKPGLYTLRFSYFPANGDHQGVAPQRDFLVLSPAGADSDPKSTPGFEPLMDLGRKSTGRPHPGVLGIWKGDGQAGFAKEGESDWVWHTKIGSAPVNIILIGKYEG